jgi:hypothetical protein
MLRSARAISSWMTPAARQPSALAAQRFRQLGRDEAQGAHLAHQGPVQHACAVALLEARRHALGGKAARLVGQRTQVVVEVRVHLGAYLAYLRKSGLRFSLKALTPSRDSSVS